MLDDGLDFSFSGLKTAVVNHVRKPPRGVDRGRGRQLPGRGGGRAGDQGPPRRAWRSGRPRLAIGGGVAANSLLREQFLTACTEDGLQAFLPSRSMCTDNAAMIASAGWYRLRDDGPTPLDCRRGSQPPAVHLPMSPAGPGPADRDEWADRFDQQAAACHGLGSPLYGRLLHLIAEDIRADGPSWAVMAERADLRFGQAGPLRLVGAAHRLALAGRAPGWARLLPSCGGAVPAGDARLREEWLSMVGSFGDDLRTGLDREVQTNEVARSAGLGLALARTGFPAVRLVELGCSGGLNLRLDRFRIDLGGDRRAGPVLGDPASVVRLAPAVDGAVGDGPALPVVEDRIGIDPHPVDPTSEDGRLTLLSFVWPDQVERLRARRRRHRHRPGGAGGPAGHRRTPQRRWPRCWTGDARRWCSTRSCGSTSRPTCAGR